MKRALTILGAAAFALAGTVGFADEHPEHPKDKDKKEQPEHPKKEHPKKSEVVFGNADKGEFKEVIPGVSRCTIWGDPAKGTYGAYTKFAPGLDAGMHTHTHDVWLVVLKGAYLYKDDAGEKRLAAGEFIRVPAGHKHWSGGDAKEGALFYQEGSGPFDLVPVK